MDKMKCITFDKEAQDALPDHIKAKMKADRDAARTNQLHVGMRVDIRIGDEWMSDYATIIYFEQGLPVAEMNRPGYPDGCRWAYKYQLENIRPHKTGKV